MSSRFPILVLLLLGFMIGPVTAEPEPVITKEMALRAITLFRSADPLSEEALGFAAIIVRFVDKNHDVLVKLSPKVFPVFGAKGVSQRETTILLAAFSAGNIDSQILHGIRKDDPYSGDLQLIQTYRQLQKHNRKLKIEGIEKLAELESRGQLKAYILSKQ